MYLRISVLAQAINVTIKVNDGTRINEADSSTSQCCPVKPNGQIHSYLRGGWWSRQRPPFWHGWNRHSLSLMHSRPDALKPTGQLCTSRVREQSNVCQLQQIIFMIKRTKMTWNETKNEMLTWGSSYVLTKHWVNRVFWQVTILRKQNYSI